MRVIGGEGVPGAVLGGGAFGTRFEWNLETGPRKAFDPANGFAFNYAGVENGMFFKAWQGGLDGRHTWFNMSPVLNYSIHGQFAVSAFCLGNRIGNPLFPAATNERGGGVAIGYTGPDTGACATFDINNNGVSAVWAQHWLTGVLATGNGASFDEGGYEFVGVRCLVSSLTAVSFQKWRPSTGLWSTGVAANATGGRTTTGRVGLVQWDRTNFFPTGTRFRNFAIEVTNPTDELYEEFIASGAGVVKMIG